jgi:hypothetical protein
VNVRFQQGQADFAHRCIHVRDGELTAPPQLVEYLV